jgi:transposase
VNIVADCGYSNGAQAAICEAAGLIPHIPAKRGTNNYAGRTLMDRTMFTYQPETDSFVCPAGQRLERKRIHKRDQSVHYQSRAADCKNCSLKPQCTLAPQRVVTGSQTEMSIAVMAYNLKRMANVLGFEQLKAQLATQ